MRPPSSVSDDFVIQGGGNDFANRQKQIFKQLSEAARECNKNTEDSSLSQRELEILGGHGGSMGLGSRSIVKQNRREMRQYRGKESIFKRPECPAPTAVRKIIADHHKNPHKWVKYSLEDVQNEQMSDRSNTQTAFAFLKELRARRERERCERDNEEKMDTDEPDPDGSLISANRCKFTSQIQYRKSLNNRETKEPPVVIVERDDKPVFQNSKIILPEYVVGQKPEKKVKKARPVVKVDRSKQLRLAHLEQLDE